jgi:putative glutamine amidotransferase
MRKIAVTQRLILNDNYYELREALDVKWGELFKELDFLPIILPFEYNFEQYFKTIKINGIVLTGGNDLNSLNPSDESKQRDDFEFKLIKYGIENNIPILGVCRGMQIIVRYFKYEFKKITNQVAIKHKLIVNNKSIYKQYLDKIDMVNAYHNYAVELINDEFIISAWNEDKTIIKAIEHKKYRIFGQMWHSEREEPFNKNELDLIRIFFD